MTLHVFVRFLYTLQHTATHCNTLQHSATHCNTLQHTTTHCNTLQHTATLCNTLQHSATHCNTLQHTATHGASAFARASALTLLMHASTRICVCTYTYTPHTFSPCKANIEVTLQTATSYSTPQHTETLTIFDLAKNLLRSPYTLQHTAKQCNTLQHTATHCNTLQHTATHCNTLNTLQHTATHCNTLQHTATQHRFSSLQSKYRVLHMTHTHFIRNARRMFYDTHELKTHDTHKLHTARPNQSFMFPYR